MWGICVCAYHLNDSKNNKIHIVNVLSKRDRQFKRDGNVIFYDNKRCDVNNIPLLHKQLTYNLLF